MTEGNYIYKPDLKGKLRKSDKFRCKTPMAGTKQVFLIDAELEPSEDAQINNLFKQEQPFGEISFKLKKSNILEDILQLISVRADSNLLDLSYSHNLLFEESSQANILFCSHTMNVDRFVTQEGINIVLEEGSIVNMVLMQNEHNDAKHICNIKVDIAKNAKLNLSLMSLHGGVIENNIEINLDGKGAECVLNGLYLVDGEQCYSSHVKMNHLTPNCSSNQLFKGVLDDNSLARFSGVIYVAPDAQKTEALQANHNLLSSENAKILTEPHLEIYADDVKCSHGATIGRLDEQALFYMRSRGIANKEAQTLQQLAFVHEVLARIKNEELRERLSNLAESRLRGEFSHCKDCGRNCC